MSDWMPTPRKMAAGMLYEALHTQNVLTVEALDAAMVPVLAMLSDQGATGTTSPPRRHKIDLDEIEFLLAAGENAENACRRLGYKPDSIAHAYYRAGRPADARPFWAYAQRLNRQPAHPLDWPDTTNRPNKDACNVPAGPGPHD